MKKIGLFIISTLLCALLCSCSSDYDKYIDEVKTGYLGGCFDDTISEVFEQTMPKGKWDGGETDDGKIIDFKVSAYDEAGLIGEGTHQRAIIDNERFMAKTNSKLNR